MRVRVLGSAAGSRFPEWNSNTHGCGLAGAGDAQALRQTLASVAVGADGHDLSVPNASPDAALHQGPATLLTLRERQPSTIRATANVHEILTSNTICDVVPMTASEHLEVAREAPVHINNLNPILVDDAPERSAVEATGWQVAFGGMEFAL